MNIPYQWNPTIVSTQIFKIGNVYILAGPSEFTTMAGRRLRNTVAEAIRKVKPKERHPNVVLAGMTSIYTHYATTLEEYQAQRYEGASTLYGPYTLQAYQQQYKFLAEKLAKEETIKDQGPVSPDLYNKAKISNQWVNKARKVVLDRSPFGRKFGDCILQPPSLAKKGAKTVVVEFVSGHPRNNPLLEQSFLYVEKLSSKKWEIIAVDTDIETRFEWIRTNFVLGESKVRISWVIPLDTKPGTYRIRHVGSYKKLSLSWDSWFPVIKEKISGYKGSTRPFQVE